MASIWRDVRYACRVLSRKRAFAVVAILTLGLGIGANTALFSVVNAVLLQPLPYASPDRLAVVSHDNRRDGDPRQETSYPTFLDLRQRMQTFEDLAAVSPDWNVVLTGRGDPEQLSAYYVSGSFFSVLGVRPLVGRALLATDDRPNARPAVVISGGFWQRRFGSDPSLEGKTITLDGTAAEVVGVMPAGFRYGEDVDVWVPLSLNPLLGRGRALRFLALVGRLKGGATLAQAQAEMTTRTRQLEQQYPDTNGGLGATVVKLHEQVVGDARPALLVLLGAVALVLLITCANVANLLLGRAASRERELAVRKALGAERGQLVRQFLTESVLLGLVGGGVGLLLATWGIDLLRAFSPANLPRAQEIHIDAWVLGFTFAVSVATGVVFGLVPALQFARSGVQALKDGGRVPAAAGRHLRGLLVIVEVALALALLVGAGLLIRSFVRLIEVDPGFNPRNVLTLYAHFPQGPPSAPLVAVRTDGDAADMVAAVRARIRQVDRDVVVWNVATMEQRLGESVAQRRFNMALVGLFAMLALALAAVGIYGIVNHAVTQRVPEIGVRMALGAQPRDVLALVIGQSMKLVALGIAAGLLAALSLTRLLRTLLFGITPTDPASFAVTVAVLAIVAFTACGIPAWRATRIDPLLALREER